MKLIVLTFLAWSFVLIVGCHSVAPTEANPAAIKAEGERWLAASTPDALKDHGFRYIWVQKNRSGVYEVGPFLCGGGIAAADDRTKVKVGSIKALCRHLKGQGFVVVPSEQIRIYFAVCGNVP